MVKVSAGLPWNAEDKRHANELLRALAPTARPKWFSQKKEKRTKRAETAAIRKEVFARAGGRCEHPDCDLWANELDHWESGSGRRTQKQTVENCWALCRKHHSLRTLNLPDAAHRNRNFGYHCFIHGFKFTPHIVHEQVNRSGSRANP